MQLSSTKGAWNYRNLERLRTRSVHSYPTKRLRHLSTIIETMLLPKYDVWSPHRGQREAYVDQIRDIEDLGTLGKKIGVCPYYATRSAIRPSEVSSLSVSYRGRKLTMIDRHASIPFTTTEDGSRSTQHLTEKPCHHYRRSTQPHGRDRKRTLKQCVTAPTPRSNEPSHAVPAEIPKSTEGKEPSLCHTTDATNRIDHSLLASRLAEVWSSGRNARGLRFDVG